MRRKKRNRMKIKESVVKTATDYAATTTVHGLSYAFDASKVVFDRLLWLLVCIVLFALAIYFSVTAYVQWQDNPVLTSVKTTGECSIANLNE